MPTPTPAATREPRSDVIRRRLVTITRDVVLLLAVTLLAPFLIVAVLLVDALRWVFTRSPFMGIRALAFAWVFLATELVGVLWLFVLWIGAGFGSREVRLVASAWQVQTWWATTLFRAVEFLFGLEVQVTDLDVARPGPILALFRHASIVDNLLPATLLSTEAGLHLRWILKRELLTIPALDVGGNRLPNYFVDRTSRSPAAELERIRALADGLGEDDGILIYPEGTRFTAAKRRRAIARLKSRPELAARAAAMRYVLPPRVGGVLELLDSGVDVVVCAHQGLGGFASVGDIWAGGMVGTTVRVRFWRIEAGDIPKSHDDRVSWLFSQWERIDDWIATQVDSSR